METEGRVTLSDGSNKTIVAILCYATSTVRVLRLDVKDDESVEDVLESMGYDSQGLNYEYMYGPKINFEFNL